MVADVASWHSNYPLRHHVDMSRRVQLTVHGHVRLLRGGARGGIVRCARRVLGGWADHVLTIYPRQGTVEPAENIVRIPALPCTIDRLGRRIGGGTYKEPRGHTPTQAPAA